MVVRKTANLRRWASRDALREGLATALAALRLIVWGLPHGFAAPCHHARQAPLSVRDLISGSLGAILAAEAVQFDGVAKAFGGVPVLDGVNLSFPAGLTTAVVGESGSGKTTLLQLINGVLQPDAGRVSVFGEAVPRQAVERYRRRIGYAVQGAGLFPHLTNRQNVVLLAQLEGWTQDAIEARYAELLEEMDLPEEVSRRYPHQLSGGQQQRVGLCRALMLKPGLLLLDEPFSAVDPITRVGIYERFEFVQRHEGVSTVLVTHDMREAVHLGDRLVILRAGQVVRSGTTDEVVNAPGDAYVEQLVNQQL